MTDIESPHYWRARAARSRDLADQASNPDLRLVLLDTAADYEVLANMVAQRHATPPEAPAGDGR
jgi:hypothetical protein